MAEEVKETQETAEKAAPKKKSKKDKEIEALKAELDSQKDLLLRTAAEFDNYKKRTEKEKNCIRMRGQHLSVPNGGAFAKAPFGNLGYKRLYHHFSRD